MNYQEIFEKSRKLILANDASGIEGHLAVQVDIKGEGEGAFYIELNDGKIAVEPYEYYDRDCKLIISAADFLDICGGSLDAVKAFTNGKLKIEGDIDKALRLSEIFNQVKEKNQNKKSSGKKK
ncbi:MAG: SCP2 sterol-binding domain-containing protein [Ruminococcus sp.]|nr:SCP2 sterol-binding domain-containing protein [Ruminococcus sp.]MCM1381871.1 SCP2 sterol-binding domain-containing protein [Muribaculaceae bacterium]MCM1478735.1 SCP2 sterol-binding domain-containing protein [Muribaculaceae bacterium]